MMLAATTSIWGSLAIACPDIKGLDVKLKLMNAPRIHASMVGTALI